MSGFKRSNPGCQCCATGLPLQAGDQRIDYYNHNTPAIINFRNLAAEYPGDTPSVVGIDVERKYILVQLNPGDDIHIYDPQQPALSADQGQIFDATSDIASGSGGFITYFDSTGFSHVSTGFTGNSSNTIAVLNSTGNYLHGPYSHINNTVSGSGVAGSRSCFFTINSVGDIYSLTRKIVAQKVYYRILKNDDHLNPTVDFEVDMTEYFQFNGGIGSAMRCYMTGFMCDGTNFYIHVESDPTGNYRNDDVANLLETGFYSINMGTGAITLEINSEDLTGFTEDLISCMYADWNDIKNRFEGFTRHSINGGLEYSSWFNLDGSLFRKNVLRYPLGAGPDVTQKWIIFSPEETIP
jgi:hypothetical protein